MKQFYEMRRKSSKKLENGRRKTPEQEISATKEGR